MSPFGKTTPSLRRLLPLWSALALFHVSACAQAPAKQPFAIDDLYSLQRVSDAQVSPDGRWIAHSVRTVSLEKNSGTTHLWVIPAAGGEPRQLTNHEKGESRPRWSPDSRQIAFLSSRSGSVQIWTIAVDGGEARQVTTISTGADNHVWSPAGTHLAFTSDVWPELEGDAAQKKREEEIETSGIKALAIDHLLYRHWNEYRRGKRTHVFVVPASGGEAADRTPGDADAPPFSLGGPDSFAISPDGQQLAFTRGPSGPGEAWTTNVDLWLAPLAGGEATNLTAANKGWDGSPVWSPDGKRIAYRSQERDGYEADRFRLAVLSLETKQTAYLAGDIDRSVDEILWAPGGETLYIGAEDEGRAAIFSVPLRGLEAAPPMLKIFSGANFTSLTMPRQGEVLVGEVQSLTHPVEVARLSLRPGGTLERLTHVNDAFLAGREMPAVESVRYPGALGASVQAWLLKPPHYQAGKRYPLVMFIHGGPQGAWQDAFSFRWNPALYAARGFLVLAPNPHGSTGFGQAFTEQISKDWGGACYEDVMKAADWAIAQGLAEPDRMAAMGGSFGGYMVNWILGHTDRFKALVSHAGVYNLEAKYGATEELWFPEWEFGSPPWQNRELYEKFSPHRHAAKFRTPTLVIHGELDYRVPVTEGFQLFTALQRQGVESKLLYYPDEGHWVLKPKNSKLWNETVTAWLEKHLGKP